MMSMRRCLLGETELRIDDEGLRLLSGGRACRTVGWDTAVVVQRDGRRMGQGAPLSVQEVDGNVVLDFPDAQLRLSIGDGLELTVSSPGALAVELGFLAGADEHYLGLGERFDKVDQRGNVVTLEVTNSACGTRSYKPISWLMSSKGFGLAGWDDARQTWHLAAPSSPKEARWVVEADELRASLWFGDYRALLREYTTLAGRPGSVPDWALEPWISGDWRTDDQGSVLDSVRKMRERGHRVGVRLIDAMWEPHEHSFDFSPVRYDDPDAMLRQLEEDGVAVVLWTSPNWTLGEEHCESERRGHLIRNGQGDTYVHPLGNQPGWRGSALDFTNPEARSWWQERVEALLLRGVRGFKTDFGEQLPNDAVLHDGSTGMSAHNAYPRWYNEATWEVVAKHGGLTLARSAWVGSQGCSAVWAGDQSSDTNTATGMGSAIVAGQTAGLSGFPLWTHDIGGYYGEPTDELYMRWTQFGAFTPFMQVHGLGRRYPWEFSASAEDNFREHAQVHHLLGSLTRALVREASASGVPVLRAMALEFPEHPESYEPWVSYQYLYGADLLVAPLFFQGPRRTVFLPGEGWLELHSGLQVDGPVAHPLEVPAHVMPLYLRPGGVLPLVDHDRRHIRLICNPHPSRGSALDLDAATVSLEPARAGRSTLNVVASSDWEFEVSCPGHSEALSWQGPAERELLTRTSNERTAQCWYLLGK